MATAAEDAEELLIDLLDDEEIDATEYSIGWSVEDNEIRLQFLNEDRMLSTFITDSTGAYDLAQRLLRAYDKLEGLDK